MSDLVAVLPILDASYGQACLDTIVAPDSAFGLGETDHRLGSLLVVDNTQEGLPGLPYGCDVHRDPDGHNLGVARSWNRGVARMYELDADYVVLVSASMRFGPILHTTFVRQMETFWGTNVIECEGHSWHLIAIHRRVFDAVGRFDENFYPAYEESIDFGYRMRLVGMEGTSWRNVWVNAMSAGAAWHTKVVSCPNGPLRAYYERKWGGPKGAEKFTLPFGGAYDDDVPLGFFPERSIPELADDYGLEVWW